MLAFEIFNDVYKIKKPIIVNLLNIYIGSIINPEQWKESLFSPLDFGVYPKLLWKRLLETYKCVYCILGESKWKGVKRDEKKMRSLK